ncbi:MAG: TIR domain-containing protein [Ignavibacteria bacterium]|nr:TIR domain-containing protein [Ignavibacteria bacterium]
MSSSRAPQPFRAFLSYSSKDKKFAGRIKALLEVYNVDAFLAHEDISPAADWQQTILKELNRCNVFMPLITKQNFHDSYWTDQECGFALARNKVILPISSRIPYGFLEKFQAHKRKPGKKETDLIEDVLAGLARRKPMGNRFLASVISALRASSSTDQSIALSKFLLRSLPFSTAQMNTILRNSLAQPQVLGSSKAVKLLRQLVRRNPKKAEKVLVNRFNKKVTL